MRKKNISGSLEFFKTNYFIPQIIDFNFSRTIFIQFVSNLASKSILVQKNCFQYVEYTDMYSIMNRSRIYEIQKILLNHSTH